MPFCSRCGKPNVQDASFCNYCGHQISEQRAPPAYRIVTLRHAYCNGSGRDTEPLIPKTCQTCNGTGKVSLRIAESDRLVTCRICSGSGVDSRTAMRGVECKNCHGTGQVPEKVPTY
jgi:DnaJ-class molecular chaperone